MDDKKLEKATFAGGCFWCMQDEFDSIPGVISTTVGYTGGVTDEPTYDEVSTGKTGHAEAIEITFDPQTVSYSDLLEIFWHSIDPTTVNQQFADKGSQYRTAIFFHNDKQRRIAEESKESLFRSGKFGKPIVTEIIPASAFFPAETYHQFYSRKCPVQYAMYKRGSGRAAYMEKKWAK